jgi:hypothetical protein
LCKCVACREKDAVEYKQNKAIPLIDAGPRVRCAGVIATLNGASLTGYFAIRRLG